MSAASFVCSNVSNQQLYLIGAATSITAYSCITSAFAMSAYPIRRNLHLLLSSLTTLVCCIVAIYINITATTQGIDDPVGLNLTRSANDLTGLNAIPLLLGVLFASLAALHRYTSYMKDKGRVLTLSIVSGAIVLFIVVSLGLCIFDVLTSPTYLAFSDTTSSCPQNSNGTYICTSGNVYFPTLPTFNGTVKSLTVVIPFVHFLFGMIMLWQKLKNPPPTYRTTSQKIEAIVTFLLAYTIIGIWFIYVVVQLQTTAAGNMIVQGIPYASTFYAFLLPNIFTPGLSTGGLIGPIYLVCHSFALICEGGILSSQLNLNGEEEEEEEAPKDNFFTTTMKE